MVEDFTAEFGNPLLSNIDIPIARIWLLTVCKNLKTVGILGRRSGADVRSTMHAWALA